ncbi:hypothetical protein SAMN04487970_101192 [Paenibacillus tianmuensis]|uniref:DUF2264 domain-containing protein n=1 Tax=Paenibacillus tianmuensis TaxID=624147 RepID=A0A1G4R389_9BACL|nr:DUF2264 domain-containing protein [Paenibacillus tianmuensis]SCW51178.1 hypothetical protein SAMN04487970_101192 [Paenibacillus tianmuensis]
MTTHADDRDYWLQTMQHIAKPVLEALSQRKLKERMPVEAKLDDRELYTYLEAYGRLLAGIAPWLEHGPRTGAEGELRGEYVRLARLAMDATTDPQSPDRMNFSEGYQPIVDAAFLAHAILRAPTALWSGLDDHVKANVKEALRATRSRKPWFNNWLLFAAMIEAALCVIGDDTWDPMRIDYALKQHEQWYLGDGMYGDGPHYHADYYNSFVIQPMLLDLLEAVGDRYPEWASLRERVQRRALRYAAVQERSISPEGTFPVVGRSLAYRFGAFQLLGQMALREQLPDDVAPAQVRCALTEVMRRMIEAPGTFDAGGWLTIGFCGHQPEIGEPYISTGSLYLCATVFLPLGLSADRPFWQGEAADWTSRKAWSGGYTPADHALE